jgi:hypothetical protein
VSGKVGNPDKVTWTEIQAQRFYFMYILHLLNVKEARGNRRKPSVWDLRFSQRRELRLLPSFWAVVPCSLANGNQRFGGTVSIIRTEVKNGNWYVNIGRVEGSQGDSSSCLPLLFVIIAMG